jgi:hypothetical protein
MSDDAGAPISAACDDRVVRRPVAATVAVGAILLGGCGSAVRHRTALQRQIGVIRAWSSALRRGDVDGAAAYFGLPSLFVNGVELRIHDRREARFANASLPCGARFVSAEREGRYINALFVLTGRPGPGGSDCGAGAGQTARTDFIIRAGKIVLWARAPDVLPGGTPQPPGPTGPSQPVAI